MNNIASDIPIFTYRCGFCARKFSNKEYYSYMQHLKIHQDNRLSELLIKRKTTKLTATNQKDKNEFERLDKQ